MSVPVRPKDPDAVLRYAWDFTAIIDDGVTVSSQTVDDTTGGITVGTLNEQDGVVSAFVSGGTLGLDATATVRVGLSDGQSDDLTLLIPIRSA